jgi:GNAT superfamily N-acetyltransferase
MADWWKDLPVAEDAPSTDWWADIPLADQPDPAMPQEQEALGSLFAPSQPQVTDLPLSEVLKDAISAPPDPFLKAVEMSMPPPPQQEGVDITDRSSAPGDFDAGMLMMGQAIPGWRAGGAIGGLDASASERGETAYLNQEADALELEIPKLPVEEQAFAREQVAQLRQRAAMADPYMTGREDQLQSAEDTYLGELVSVLPDLLQSQAAIEQIPMNPTAEKVLTADTWSGAGSAFLEDPLSVLRTFALRSLPAAAPSIAGAVAGQALGGPMGAAAGAGAGSYGTEASLSVAQGLIEVARSAGVDVADPAAVSQWVTENQDALREVLSDANTRGLLIAGADALTGGLTGRIAQMVSRASPLRRAAVTGATGTLVEPIGEAGGEALAQKATTGDVKPGDVIAEAIGGLAMGGPTAIAQGAVEAQRTPGRELGREMERSLREAQVAPTERALRMGAPEIIAAPRAPEEDREAGAPRVQNAPRPVSGLPPGEPGQPVPDVAPALVDDAANLPGAVPDGGRVSGAGRRRGEQARPELPGGVEGNPDVPAVPEPVEALTDDEAQVIVPEGEVEAQAQAAPVEAAPVQVNAPVESIDGLEIQKGDGFAKAYINGEYAGEVNAAQKGPFISSVVVEPKFQGIGVGRALYAEADKMVEGGIIPSPLGLTERTEVIWKKRLSEMPAGEAARVIERSKEVGRSYGISDGDLSARLDKLMPQQGNTPAAAQSAQAEPELFERASPEFKQWFGGSAAVDDKGSPVRVFHGTWENFENFDLDKSGTNTRARDAKGAIFFTDRADVASSYAEGENPYNDRPYLRITNKLTGGFYEKANEWLLGKFGKSALPQGGNVRPAYLSIKNPRIVDFVGREYDETEFDAIISQARRAGHDGVIIRNVDDAAVDGSDLANVYVVFSPDQVRSTFDASNRKSPPATSQARGVKPSAPKKQQLSDATPRDNTGRRPRGKLSPGFLKFSFSNRPSVFAAAFRDAGIDPDEARLMDQDKQISAISKMLKDRFGVTVVMPRVNVTRKNIVGRSVKETKRTITTREALDQLLDAYRQMQMLASIMGMPEKVIGLEIEGKGIQLSLVGRKRLGALGMFSWDDQNNRTITLPGRSNSFAHEWGHALDHFLTTQVHRPHLKGMLSRNMDDPGVQPMLNPRYLVTEAFARLMHAMYGDKAKLGALMLRLQVEGSKIGGDGSLTPSAIAAQKQMNAIKEGKRLPDNLMSQYFKSSQEYDQLTGAGGYFTDPAEMFARAFEAWVGRTVSQVSDLPQAFLSKSDWAYNSMEDPRLEMTFPKEADADQFAVAMTELSHAMQLNNLGGMDKPASAPADLDIYDPNKFLLRPQRIGMAQKEAEALRESWRTIKAMVDPGNVSEALKSVGRDVRKVYQTLINTGAAAMFAVANRQESAAARQALTNIAAMVATRPGQGKLTKGVYQRDMEMLAYRRLNKIEGAIRRRMGEKRLTAVQIKQLNTLLRGGKDASADSVTRGIASDLRAVMDEIWYDLVNSGIDVGYERGYLPFVLDTEAVMNDRAGFRRDATKVYELWFDRDVVNEPDPDAQIKDIRKIINDLEKATKSLAKGDKAPDPRLTDEDLEAIEMWKEIRGKIAALQRQLKTSKDPDKIQAKIDALMPDYEAALADVLERLKERWSEWKAETWDVAMGVGQLNDFASFGPTTQFTKKRKLPQEAGVILLKYMQEDPISLASGYAFAAARRSEWAKRFGPADEKLETMLSAASREGVSDQDIDFFKLALNAAGGRFEASSRGWQILRNYTYVYGTIRLLGLATFASLAEPVTAALRTGSIRDGGKALISLVKTLLSQGRRDDLKEISRAIGLIAPAAMDQLLQNRVSGDVGGISKTSENLIQKFFQLNGLTGLTNFQRITMAPIAHEAIVRWLRKDVAGKGNVARDVIAGGKGKFVDGELNELGISKEERADLLTWLDGLGHMPTAHDLYQPDGQFHPAAELWARAVSTLVNEIIQNPLKTDRAIQANHPDHAALYGIMSFMDAFSRNIIERSVRRGFKPDDGVIERGAKFVGNIALTAAPFAALYGAQFLATIFRESLMNGDKWEEMEEDGTLWEWLAALTFTRTMGVGRLTPIYDMWTGIRYERDLTSITSGPYLGVIFQDMMTILKQYQGRNSENTNTAEYNAFRAFYQLAIMPAAAMALSAVAPLGPVTQVFGRTALIMNADKDNAKAFAEGITGEKGRRYEADEGKPWFESGEKAEEE